MNNLLIVPELGLKTDNEVFDITNYVHSTFLTGQLTLRKIFQSIGRQNFNFITIISHMNPYLIQIRKSDGLEKGPEEVMKESDLLMLCDLTRADTLFLNGCESSRLANYCFLNSNTLKYAIHSTLDIYEHDAWKFPLQFFRIFSVLNDVEKSFHQIKSNYNSAYYGLYKR